jgi:hypothetical protein
MTVADLKRRLQPGVTMRNTARLFKPELIGDIVTVKHNTSEGLQLLRRGETSYMPWPKASRLQGDTNGFTIFTDDSRVLVAYEFTPPPIS